MSYSFLSIILKLKSQPTFFFIFPAIGIFFSIIALKELFGVKSDLANNFCNFGASTSCNDVIDSNKWRIFTLINFGDLSIFLFASQFLGIFIFMLSGNLGDFFLIQKMLLLVSLPVIFVSLYYQKFVVNKWCPLCLTIILIIFLELGCLFLNGVAYQYVSFNSLKLFGLVFFSSSLIWLNLKKVLINRKELHESLLKANRFIRNYEIFKNVLLCERKMDFPEIPIILGNKESNTTITLISSPFCKYCKDAHEILEDILSKDPENLKMQIILKTQLNQSIDQKKLFKKLYEIYSDNEQMFIKALNEWYDKKNLINWNQKYDLNISGNFDEIINIQNDWCIQNEINYTPSIFINGYEFPKSYERENLKYFINELVEDNF